VTAREPMRDLVAYLAVLAGPDPAGDYLELRYRADGRGMRQRFIDAARPSAAAAAITALARSRDVYVGCVPRTRRAGGKNALARCWTVWADCDTPASIAVLEDFAPQPAVIVRSGRGQHAYWPLAEPLPPAEVERANRRLAHKLGACGSAVTNAAAILRPPTSRNFKYDPPAPVVLARFTGERFNVEEVAGRLPDPPNRWPARRERALWPRSNDPLHAIEPAVYVEALTGRRVGRDGKVACPLHPDNEPSLHVYPDHWTCFSAKCWRGDRPNGGDIYNLAAQLLGLSHQGGDFRELQRRLYALFLPGVEPPRRAARQRSPALVDRARAARSRSRAS
jgi:hypothetical protein